MRRFSRYSLFLLLVTTFFLVQTNAALWAQGSSAERIFFHAKVFTGDPQNPYAEAVAIRGDKIVAVGNLPEVVKSAPANAERVDLEGKSLFPGFIDSHSHSIDGGLGLISADASEKVHALNDLPAFAEDAKKTGKGMRGDILEILGLPLEFWSHCDTLNAMFSTGAYEKQSVILRGMDGHTAWANRALLQRAGITADFLKKLSANERSYYGTDKDKNKDMPNGFLVDAGTEKIEPLLPEPTSDSLLAAGRAALQYNYSLGITAWLDPLASDYVLRAYKMLADRGELTSQVVAFPQVLAKDPAAELAAVQKTRAAYKNVPNLHVTGIKVFADGVAEYPSQTAHLSQPYKNTGRNGDLLFDPKKFAEVCVAADKQGLIVHVHAIGDRAERARRVDDMLDVVGLPRRLRNSYPNQLSGGQRQRVVIARALVLRPQLLVCDEPTSALDVSVQAQILNLLLDLRREFGLTYVIISHNLAVVEHMATEVAVMYLGRIVERTDAEALFRQPLHPYTRALLRATMTIAPRAGIPDTRLGGAVPDPTALPTGCRFHPRCPEALPICRDIPPPAIVTPTGTAECHLLAQQPAEGVAA